jgi:hypothetical protein
MKRFLFCFLGSFLCAASVLSQAPAAKKPDASAPKLEPKDIRDAPFVREFKEKKFKRNDRDVPDELRVTVFGGNIHLYGKKRGDVVRIEGRPSGHVGKAVFIPPVTRAGKLTVKAPSADEVTYYYAALELADAVDSKIVKLTVGKTYDWLVKSENGQTSLRVVEGATELASLTAPAEKVTGVGFAATVRSKGNEADITLSIP